MFSGMIYPHPSKWTEINISIMFRNFIFSTAKIGLLQPFCIIFNVYSSSKSIDLKHTSIITFCQSIYKKKKIGLTTESFYRICNVYSIWKPFNSQRISIIVSIQCVFQLNFRIILVSTSQSRICEFISNTKILIIFQNIQLCNVYGIVIIFNIHLMLFETIIKYELFIFSQQMVILGIISFIVILQQSKQMILCLFDAFTLIIILLIIISIFLFTTHQSAFSTANTIFIKSGIPFNFVVNEG